MKKIKLTQGKFALVSDKDYKWLSQWKWYASKHGKTFYARRSTVRDGMRTNVFMHREILKLFDSRVHTDHRSGNGLDNRRSNLRKCSASQNSGNRIGNKNNKSGYRGVYWCTDKGMFVSQIRSNYTRVFLGCYKTKTAAARAYDNAARNHFGTFARLNFA